MGTRCTFHPRIAQAAPEHAGINMIVITLVSTAAMAQGRTVAGEIISVSRIDVGLATI